MLFASKVLSRLLVIRYIPLFSVVVPLALMVLLVSVLLCAFDTRMMPLLSFVPWVLIVLLVMVLLCAFVWSLMPSLLIVPLVVMVFARIMFPVARLLRRMPE